MRRLSRVLGVAVLAGAALAVAPAPGADAAGTASLTVRTLDRAGHAVGDPGAAGEPVGLRPALRGQRARDELAQGQLRRAGRRLRPARPVRHPRHGAGIAERHEDGHRRRPPRPPRAGGPQPCGTQGVPADLPDEPVPDRRPGLRRRLHLRQRAVRRADLAARGGRRRSPRHGRRTRCRPARPGSRPQRDPHRWTAGGPVDHGAAVVAGDRDGHGPERSGQRQRRDRHGRAGQGPVRRRARSSMRRTRSCRTGSPSGSRPGTGDSGRRVRSSRAASRARSAPATATTSR